MEETPLLGVIDSVREGVLEGAMGERVNSDRNMSYQ